MNGFTMFMLAVVVSGLMTPSMSDPPPRESVLTTAPRVDGVTVIKRISLPLKAPLNLMRKL
jgi:hypothetical protein